MKVKKLIGFTEDQVEALNILAQLDGNNLTAQVLTAVDSHLKIRTGDTLPLARRIIEEDASLIELLSKS